MSNWKERALAATRGTQLGAIVAAATDTTIDAPCFSGHATVTSDGFIMCNFTDANGGGHMGAFVGSTCDLVRNARGLADHLKLNTAERGEMFATLRQWVGSDYSNGSAMRKLEVMP